MALSPYLSKMYPGLARGLVSIPAADAGVAIIDSGLKDPIVAVTGGVATAHAAGEEEHVVFDWFGKPGVTDLEPGQIRMTVTKGDASAADSDVDVAFQAHADR